MQNTTVKFILKDGKLELLSEVDKVKYKIFNSSLQEDDIVEVYLTKIDNKSDATLGQIAKVHASIRELARFTGHTFEEMKDTVKEKAGLYDPAISDYKSFGNCSKEELSEAIQICITIGNDIGCFIH